MRRVLAKARREKRIVLGAIGGSITHWVAASRPEFRYVNRVAAWIEGRTGAEVVVINAGRGATGSNFAALRVGRDLLGHRPDLVVLDFAVNDGPEERWGRSQEGLVRQLRSAEQDPALAMIFFMRKDGGNAQERLMTVARHYGIGAVSYRDAVWPEIEAGRMRWEDVSPDEVHPNDRGHELAAGCLIELLERAERGEGEMGISKVLPAPLYTDVYQFTEMWDGAAAVAVGSCGWDMDAHGEPWPGWRANEVGAWVEFEVRGTAVVVMYYKLRANMGRVRVSVDGRDCGELDGWFEGTWGGWRETVTVAEGLERGGHWVRLEVVTGRHELSGGHEFRVLGVGGMGS
jgi:lysophospholipase L1-like esterase